MITDEYLQRVRQLPKCVSNPQARWTEKPGHRQRNFQATALDSDETFRIVQRLDRTDEKDFSCGIQLAQRGEEDLTLARYNGPSHRHGDIAYKCHIHHATEKAIAANRKPESEAQETDGYHSLEGALARLLADYNVSGIEAEHDQRRLL